MTARRAAFVQEYLVDLNGRQAAIRAGFSPASASAAANGLLADPLVGSLIEKAKAQRLSRVQVSQDTVINEMSLLAYSSVDHYYVDSQGNLKPTPDAPEGAMRAVQSVKKTIKIDKDDTIIYTVEFRLWDKPGPLKLMGRHIGLFPDKVEISTPDREDLSGLSYDELTARLDLIAEKVRRERTRQFLTSSPSASGTH
jgi:phage terminase small subunit